MSGEIVSRISEAVKAAGLAALDEPKLDQLSTYVSLILRWNSHVNLTSIRDEDGIISRHIVESIEVSTYLPAEVATLLDFGAGAGLPGIPIAICRPKIQVTLAESQNKKAAFLMEAVRVTGLNAKVYSGRADELNATFDCVTLRAVDKMSMAVRSAAGLVNPGGWLTLMTTPSGAQDLQFAAGPKFEWREPVRLAKGQSRILLLGQRTGR